MAAMFADPSGDITHLRDPSATVQRRTTSARRDSLIRTNPDFARADTNRPFTMTTDLAVLSTK